MELTRPRTARWRRALSALWRWALAGSAVGAAVGSIFALIALAGGDQVWAGMLLPVGLFSFPAGLWVFNLMAGTIQAGVPGATLAVLVLGPAANGAVIGAVLGALTGATDNPSRR